MLGYLKKRLLWMIPSLFGITLATFLLLDLAPGERASRALAGMDAGVTLDDQAHQAALERLRIGYGLLDPVTKQPYGLLQRYGRWLSRAMLLDFAGPGDDPKRFRQRVLEALPVTLLLNLLALLLAVGVGVPLGARLALAKNRSAEAAASLLVIGNAVPTFLWASWLVLILGGGLWTAVFPVGGLSSVGAGDWPIWRRAFDLVMHLTLPVLTLAIFPTVTILRMVRANVRAAAASDFVLALRGLGFTETHIRRRILRAGLSPLATLAGSLLPGLLAGSVVVEHVYSLHGLGFLSLHAIEERDYAMVMALTVIGSFATLLGLVAADLLHRLLDPRVVLR